MTTGAVANLGDARGRIILDASGVRAGLNEARIAMRTGFADMSNNMRNTGAQMQAVGRDLTFGLSPITAFIVQGARAFTSFDDVLGEIQARTGATAEQMELVRATAMRMRGGPIAASDAMLQLLSSGYNLEQTLAALPAVIDASVAGTGNLGQTADIVTDILAMYNLQASEAARVSNALAQASSASSAEMPDLAAGFGNVGPIAARFGLSVEQTAAILATFSENGIKGAEAGTQLKSMLDNMSRPTEDVASMWNSLGISLYDATGTIRPLNTVLEELAAKTRDMSDEQRNEVIKTLAGSYGQLGLSVLLANDGFDGMLGLMEEATDATTLAEAKTRTLRGTINLATESFQRLSIVGIGPLMNNYIRPLLVQGIEVINWITDWMLANPALAETLMLVMVAAVALGPAIWGVGLAVTGVAAMMTVVLNPFGAIILLLTALGSAYRTNLYGFRDTVDETVPQIISRVTTLWASMRAIGTDIADGVLAGLRAAWQRVPASLIGMFVQLLSQTKAYLGIASPSRLFADEIGRWIPEGIAQGMQNITPILRAIASWLAPLLAAVMPIYSTFSIVWTVVRLASAAFMTMNPILLVLVGSLVAFGVAYKTNFMGFANTVNRVSAAAQRGLDQLAISIGNVVDAFKEGGIDAALLQIEEEATGLYDSIRTAIQGIDLESLLPEMKMSGGSIWNKILEITPDLFTFLGNAAGQVVNFLITTLLPLLIAGTVIIAPELARLGAIAASSFILGFIEGVNADEILAGILMVMNAALAEIVPLAQQLVAAVLGIDPTVIAALGLALAGLAAISIYNGIVSLVAALPGLIMQLWATAAAGGGAAMGLWAAYAPMLLVGAILLALATDFGGLRTAIEQTGVALREGDIAGAMEGIGRALIAIPYGIAEAIGNMLGIDVAGGLEGWKVAFQAVQIILDKAWISFLMLAAIVTGSLAVAGERIRAFAAEAATQFNQGIENLKNLWSNFLIFLSLIWLLIASTVHTKIEEVKTKINDLKNAVTQWVADAVPTLTTNLGTFWETLKTSIQGMATTIVTEALQIGSSIVSGIRQGIDNAWQGLQDYIGQKASGLLGGFTSVLGIESPSRAFAEQAAHIPGGIKMGIETNMGSALSAMASLSKELLATGLQDGAPRSSLGGLNVSGGGTGGNVTYNIGDIILPPGAMPESSNPGQQAKDFFAAVNAEIRRKGGGLIGATG